MSERTILTWNITNWLTVILMVAVGYVLIGAALSIGRQMLGGDIATDASA